MGLVFVVSVVVSLVWGLDSRGSDGKGCTVLCGVVSGVMSDLA